MMITMKNPLKIVNCVFGDASGGRWQAMLNMNDALDSCGHEVLIVTGPENKKLKVGDKPVIFLSNSGFYDFFSAFKASCWLKQVKPDVIIAHSGRAVCLFKNAMFFNNLYIPIIAVNHSHNVKRTIRADGFIHITAHVAECVKTASHKKRIDPSNKPQTIISNLVHLPIEVPIFRPMGTPVVLGMMTRLVEYKGTHLLIDAVALLKRRGFDIKLLIAGDGEEKENLIQKTQFLGLENEIQFLGWIDLEEKKKFYQSIDIAVVPTMNDTQPLAILDAFAWGKPVVASDHISVQQVIRHGENGLMAKCGDAHALAQQIENLITDPIKALMFSKKAYQEAVQNYQFSQISKQLDQFLNGLSKL